MSLLVELTVLDDRDWSLEQAVLFEESCQILLAYSFQLKCLSFCLHGLFDVEMREGN